MPKYEIIIYWSNEDDAYVAEVPELPGCMAHGAWRNLRVRCRKRKRSNPTLD